MPGDVAPFILIWIILVGGLLYSIVLAIRHGRRLPPLSRASYLRQVMSFFAGTVLLFVVVAGVILAFSGHGFALLGFPLWAFGLVFLQYRMLRASVQRLSDIDGHAYRGIWRALLSLHFLMIIYLCCRRGAIPQTSIDIF